MASIIHPIIEVVGWMMEDQLKVLFRNNNKYKNGRLLARYTKRFVCAGDKLKCVETNKLIDPKELPVVSYHQFKSYKDPVDVSVLYFVDWLITIKEIIRDGYGPYADVELTHHIRSLEMDSDQYCKNFVARLSERLKQQTYFFN